MNALEASLLDRSIGRLGDTFLQNRVMRDRQQQDELDRAMRAETGQRDFALRERALNEQSMAREDATAARREATASVDEYRKAMAAAKSEEDKLKLWGDLVRSGTLDQKGLDAMAKAMSDKLGVSVSLKMPEEIGSPQVWEDETSGRRFGFRPGSKEMHDLTPNMGTVTEEEDPLTGEMKRRFTRRLSPKDLAPAPWANQPRSDDDAEGPDMGQQQEIDEILSRPGVSASQPAANIKRRITELQKVPPSIEGAGAAGALPEFSTEAEARQAGHKAGDVIRLMVNGKMTKVRLK